jgi:hypothetical protein
VAAGLAALRDDDVRAAPHGVRPGRRPSPAGSSRMPASWARPDQVARIAEVERDRRRGRRQRGGEGVLVEGRVTWLTANGRSVSARSRRHCACRSAPDGPPSRGCPEPARVADRRGQVDVSHGPKGAPITGTSMPRRSQSRVLMRPIVDPRRRRPDRAIAPSVERRRDPRRRRATRRTGTPGYSRSLSRPCWTAYSAAPARVPTPILA